MAKAPPPLKVCLACEKSIAESIDVLGELPMCRQCWDSMTLAEKLNRYEAARMLRQLLAIQHAVENNELLAKQTARLAKVLEALLRELKEPFNGLNDLLERMNQRIDHAEFDDEGEEWKRGGSDDDA